MKNSWIIYFIINFTAVLFSLTIGPDIIEEPSNDAVSKEEFEALMLQAAAMLGELPEPAPVTTEDPCEDPEILWDNDIPPDARPPYKRRGIQGMEINFHGDVQLLTFSAPPYTSVKYNIYGPVDWCAVQRHTFYPSIFSSRDIGDYVKYHPRPVNLVSWRNHMQWISNLRDTGYQIER